jgi:peptidoglycan/LPS O-acetylase OafA/YrhL
MEKEGKKIYFPGLDGMRLISCISIIIIHIELEKAKFNLPATRSMAYLSKLGPISVSLFFLLSGFLISYLLLLEKKTTGNINLRSFYTRRILKIWPLYFLIIFFGFFVWPHLSILLKDDFGAVNGSDWWQAFIGCVFFLPGTLLASNVISITIGVTWTIRVEEFFYFFWPILLRKTDNFIKMCIWIIVCTIMLRIGTTGIHYFLKGYPTWYDFLGKLNFVFLEYRFGCMAIGGIGSWLILNEKTKITSFFYRKDIQLITYFSTLILLMLRVHIPFIYNEFYCALLCIIIMNLANNPACLINLDYKWSNYLGKRTYGLYLFHPVAIILCISIVKQYFGQLSGLQTDLILYPSIIGITIIVSVISFRFFEKPFLKLKSAYSLIKTRE